METRIEIFRDSLWRTLRFRQNQVVKYNAVINRIAGLDVREISHSDTFSIPPIFENRDALGLNFFNSKELAKTLNSKFPAKYYVDDKLLQTGFIVINNTRDGSINLNFIEEALTLTDQWATTTFRELLTSSDITRPSDYQTAIDAMTGYNMSQTSVLTPLGEVGTRGYNLAYFPNNLNAIGDLFQLDDEGLRVDDCFNPYQSRPIFNVKALFDLACESFGYTTEFTDSIDLEVMKKDVFVAEGLGEGVTVNDVLATKDYGTVATIDPYDANPVAPFVDYRFAFLYGSGVETLIPNNITGWTDPPNFVSGYESQACIHRVDSGSETVGTISYYADLSSTAGAINSRWHDIYAIWEDASLPAGNWLFQALTPINDNSDATSVDFQINKDELSTSKPANAGYLVGIIYQERIRTGVGTLQLQNANTIEEIVPADTNETLFDSFGQYYFEDVDLTHAASTESLRTLLSSYMQKEGILVNINSTTKVAKFFTYGYYESQRNESEFYDWSKYLLKYEPFLYNTDYGGNYYKQNKIGLTEPYGSNTNIIELTNQGFESKLKSSGTNYVKNFKDVSKIVSVPNTSTPYYEYTNLGLGLIELSTELAGLTQCRADGTTQGSITDLQAVFNVNYARIPKGVDEWYKLVDTSIKVEAKFLLPLDVVKNLDLSKPVYVEYLGGFYIIEEIAEYINPQTIVNIKLIKTDASIQSSVITDYQFEGEVDYNFEDQQSYEFNT